MGDESPSTDHVDALLRTLGRRVRDGDLSRMVKCGPLTLLHLIGRGGVASVYAAVLDGETSPRFAVKVFDPGVDAEELLIRFEREREIIRSIDHPSIITVTDSGVQETGQPWFAMPRVDGLAVTREADEHRLSIRDRLLLAERACEGIAAAHAAGVIHRDIKPGNVLAAWRERGPDIKVIDFGLARALGGGDRRLTPTATVRRMGTPDYMAPEQWSDGIAACDARADVFALGMLISELAAGVVARHATANPSASSTSLMKQGRHARVAPAPPCAPSDALQSRIEGDPAAAQEMASRRGMASADALRDAVRQVIDPAVASMIAKDPADRPEDARAALALVAAARRAA